MGSRDIDERDDSDVVAEETTKTIVDVANKRGHKKATIGAMIGGGIGSVGCSRWCSNWLSNRGKF